MARHNAVCDKPLGKLYKIRQRANGIWGPLLPFQRSTFNISEAWHYITASFNAIRPSFLYHEEGQITWKINLFRQVLSYFLF